MEGGGGGDREYVSNLMFYAQSTSTVVSGRDTLCHFVFLSGRNLGHAGRSGAREAVTMNRDYGRPGLNQSR